MKAAALLFVLAITSANADEETMSVPAKESRSLMDENTELRKEVNKLEAQNDKLYDALKKQVGMVGFCT